MVESLRERERERDVFLVLRREKLEKREKCYEGKFKKGRGPREHERTDERNHKFCAVRK